MPAQPTLLQLLRPLTTHLNAAYTIANTPANRRGTNYPAVPFTDNQVVDLQLLRKWLGHRLKGVPIDHNVSWSDVDNSGIPVSRLLANLVRMVENISWGRANREFSYRSILAAQIVVQLTTELRFCDDHHAYQYELICRILNLIGEMTPHKSLHGLLEQLLTKIVQWFGTIRMDIWDPLKEVALENVFRVLARYDNRPADLIDDQWVRLINLCYAILDELALPNKGPKLTFLSQVLATRPSLLDSQPYKVLHPCVRQPNFSSIFAWFVSQLPSQHDTDIMVGEFVIDLFIRQNRIRVETVILLEFLSYFSHERVLQSLPTVKCALYNPQIMTRSMHAKLHRLGDTLEKQRALMGLPASSRVSFLQRWVSEFDPATRADPQ